jgi:hypothetical protein
LAAALTVCYCGGVAAQTAVPAPSGAQITAYAVVGDLPGFLDRVGALATKISPQMNAQSVRAMAGTMLGDPTLAAFPSGSGAAVAMAANGDTFFLVEAAPQAAATVEQVLKTRGMQTAKADRFVVGTKDPMSLSAAPQVAAMMKSAMGAKRAPMLVANIQVAKLLAQNEAAIKQQLASFSGTAAKAQQAVAPNQPQAAAAVGKILDIEARVALAMLKAVDTAQVALAPSERGLQVECGVVPVGGMSPVTPGTPDAARKLVSGSGAMRYAGMWDGKGINEFLTRQVVPALQEGGMAAADVAALSEVLGKWSAATGDSMAVDMMLPGKGMQSGTMAVAVRDPGAMLSMLETMPDLFAKFGLTEMYKGLGLDLKVSFKRNVREVKGVQIHQITMDPQVLPGASPQMAQMAKVSMAANWDLAIVDTWLVYAMGGADIGQMIDAAKAKSNPAAKPLEAEKLFGAGGRFYLDYHVGQILKMTTEMSMAQMPKEAQEMMKKMTAGMENAPPISAAAFAEAARYRASVLIPAELIGKVAQGAGSAMAGARPAGGPAAARMPGASGAPRIPGAPAAPAVR